jgi:uncharacterized protein (UPF0276 family)
MSLDRSGFPFLGYGVGLRPTHYNHVLETTPRIDWFEVISENFMVAGGRPRHILERVRERYPVALHGVSLSIGSTDPLNQDYLAELAELVRRTEPAWVSDHLCWTGIGGRNSHDLLPLPYTPEAIQHVVERIGRVQDVLGRRVLIENVSSYLTYRHSAMPEWTFLAEVVERADCGILLDINNVYVSSYNHGFDPVEYLAGVPAGRVAQFHLAGFLDKQSYLHDTHDHPVAQPVWELHAEAVRRFGQVSTLIEWDDHIPEFDRLLAEANTARTRAEAVPSQATTHHEPTTDARRDPATLLDSR